MICRIDDDTGEILASYSEKDVRLSPRIFEKEEELVEEEADEEGVMEMEKGRSFVKCDNLELEKVIAELKKTSEIKLLIGMVNRVEYKTNRVVLGRNATPTEECIADWIGLSRKSVIDAIKTLTKKRFVAKVICGEGRKRYQYYVNPWLVTKGRVVNASLKDVFQDYEIRTKGMIKWKDLDKDKEAEKWKRYRK